jgi:hypothetical protein
MVTRAQSSPRVAAPRKAAKTPVRKSPVRKSSARAPQAKPDAAAKASVRPAAPPAKPAKAPKDVKAEKVKKPKMVRDSFTIPKAEYEVLATLKMRAAKLGQTPKKSELLRAGIKVLAAMADQALLASLSAVPSIKTGRPAA